MNFIMSPCENVVFHFYEFMILYFLYYCIIYTQSVFSYATGNSGVWFLMQLVEENRFLKKESQFLCYHMALCFNNIALLI